MNIRKKYRKRIICTVLLAIGIALALIRFMIDNTNRISSQNEEYLNEFTTQRAISIDNLLTENVTFIEATAFLYGKTLSSPDADISTIQNFEENTAFDLLRFVAANGDNYTSQGVAANLADRAYFQDGMKGNSGITYVLESRVTGETQIGFYAPVYYEEEIIGVMVGFYGEAYINRLLEYSLFGSEGEGWLCTEDGTVLGSTITSGATDYFQYMSESGQMSDDALKFLNESLLQNGAGSFTYQDNGAAATGYAVMLSNTDWILIRNFPPRASLQILSNANKEGIYLILELIVMFLIYVGILGVDILLEHKRTREENQNANYISEGVSSLFQNFTLIDMEAGTYRQISGDSFGSDFPTSGDYRSYQTYIANHIEDAKLREEADAFIRLEHLRDMFMDGMHGDHVSTRLRMKTGTSECFTFNYTVLERKDGKPSLLLIICQDVTELFRKEQEEQQKLQAALERAERANNAKTAFLFNMSHDLRTPMNAITGYTELALRDGVEKEQMANFLGKIDSSGKHLLALINDILEMSRIESGKMTLEPEPCDLTEIVSDTRAMFTSQMAEKKITYTVDCSGIRDAWVLCDKNRLNRVLLNLIGNAYKFTDEQGTVAVTMLQTDSVANVATYELHVKDNGIGMSEKFVSKVFLPFERERTSTISKIEGTGLGLSITKSIVDLMNGTIDVISRQGEGTEFIVTLTLPLTENPAQDISLPASAAEEMDFSKCRFLLAEDMLVNREIAVMVLEQKGCKVETAENGQIAVDMVAASQPGYYDAVLMDIQMPVMDGYNATRAIRALPDPQLSRIPVIAMTANAFKEDVQKAKDAGMNGHIAKPLDMEKMFRTIAEVLQRQSHETF